MYDQVDSPPPPGFFVSVDSKQLSSLVSPLDATLMGFLQVLILKGLTLHRNSAKRANYVTV
jgi:hypothetical protein